MDLFEKFYNRALRFLSYRPRSEKEVREKLKALTKRHSGLSRIDSGGADASQNDKIGFLIEKVVSRLKDKKFINDEEFAKLWIESRNRSKPRSWRLIKIELKQKGIDPELIEQLIANRGSQVADDLENARKLVGKRIERLKGLDRKKIYQKLGRFLAGKGFDWETIKQVIDETLKKEV